MTVVGGSGQDTFDVGSLAGLWPNPPSSEPAFLDVNGVVRYISALLTIQGGSGIDTLNVDDTGETQNEFGQLTSTMITGLGISVGIAYSSITTLNINLGKGMDGFTVISTSAGTTNNIVGGTGIDAIAVQTIAGPTNVFGVGTHDIYVGSNATPSLRYWRQPRGDRGRASRSREASSPASTYWSLTPAATQPPRPEPLPLIRSPEWGCLA